jgi:hypothetical protein
MNDNKDRFNFVAITFDEKKKLANYYSKENDFTHIVNSLKLTKKNWALKVTLLIYS